jgi:hypothetical protein
MAKQKQSATTKNTPPPAKPESRGRAIAERGIYTAADLAAYLSATITDISTGAVTPEISNAACKSAMTMFARDAAPTTKRKFIA